MEQQQMFGDKARNVRLKFPAYYQVIMHNDDVTTMDFVVRILMQIFFKPKKEAEEVMMKIHTEGQAVIGSYPYDIALSKTKKAMQAAREEGFPLCLTMEPDLTDTQGLSWC